MTSRAERKRSSAGAAARQLHPVPGTSWKIGFDPIIGLIPGIGDLIGARRVRLHHSGSGARRMCRRVTLVRMLVNVGIDTLVGAVPAVGNVFDAAWKSNTMNVALLERHVAGIESVPGSVPVRRRNVLGVIAIALIVLRSNRGCGIGARHLGGAIALGPHDPITLFFGAVAKW